MFYYSVRGPIISFSYANEYNPTFSDHSLRLFDMIRMKQVVSVCLTLPYWTCSDNARPGNMLLNSQGQNTRFACCNVVMNKLLNSIISTVVRYST